MIKARMIGGFESGTRATVQKRPTQPAHASAAHIRINVKQIAHVCNESNRTKSMLECFIGTSIMFQVEEGMQCTTCHETVTFSLLSVVQLFITKFHCFFDSNYTITSLRKRAVAIPFSDETSRSFSWKHVSKPSSEKVTLY